MDLIWKCPGDAPDPAAIARMRQHFLRPKERMPEAWFMGEDINFYSPDPYGEAKFLCSAVSQIASGVVNFSELPYVSVWKAWFLHLLPDLILRANEPENLNDSTRNILDATMTTFFSLYPHTVLNEYPGFRGDVVSTLGTRAIPPHLAREALPQRAEPDRLFTDIWDMGPMIEIFGFPTLDEVNSSLLFCLKYLIPEEIEAWAPLLFQIDSPQWFLQMIFSLAAWRKFLNLSQTGNYNEKDFLRETLYESEMLNAIWSPPFKTLDEFILPEHVRAFERVLSEHLSYVI